MVGARDFFGQIEKKILTKSRLVLGMQGDAISKSDKFNIVGKKTFKNYYSSWIKCKCNTNELICLLCQPVGLI